MKGRFPSRSGIVLITVLVLLLSTCFLVGALTSHGIRSIYLTRRSLDNQRSFIVADAGLAYGVMGIRAKIAELGLKGFVDSADANGTITSVPPPTTEDPDYAYAFGVTVEAPGRITATEGHAIATIRCCAYNTTGSGVYCALQEEVSIDYSTLGDYAAFYEGDLEAHPGATMSFVGKVHSNADLYLGGSLQFDRNLTCVGSFYNKRKNTGAANGTSVKIRFGNDENYGNASEKDSNALKNTYGTYGGKSRYIDSELGSAWLTQASLYYGGAVRTGENGVTKLKPPISVDDDNHTIIERPVHPGTPGYNANTESQKFSNKAAITIRVLSDGSFTAYDRRGNSIVDCFTPAKLTGNKNASTMHYEMSESGQFQTSNHFYDKRERKPMAPVDLYLDKILASPAIRNVLYEFTDNDEIDPGIIYVMRDEPEPYLDITERDVVTQEIIGREEVQLYKTNSITYYLSTATRVNNGTTTFGSTSTTSETTLKNYMGSSTKKKVGDTNTKTTTTTSGTGKRKTTTTTTVTYTITDVKVDTKLVGTQINNIYSNVTQHIAVTNACVPVQPCLRIRNASDFSSIPNGLGLSIATDLPVYVEGSFNTGGKAGSAGTTSIPHSALVAGDAVTMLSRNWQDAWSQPKWTEYRNHDSSTVAPPRNVNTTRIPSDTTFNGIIMTGNVPTAGTTYSGGLENIFRFMEYWSGKTYNFNGSIICMWDSEIACGIQPSTYNSGSTGQEQDAYEAPTRKWGYARMEPPGIPTLFSVNERSWKRIQWSRSLGFFE